MVLKILLGPLSGHHAEVHLLVEVCDVNARFDEVPLTDETSWSRRGSLAWGVGGDRVYRHWVWDWDGHLQGVERVLDIQKCRLVLNISYYQPKFQR